MDETSARELLQRLHHQEWDQGSRIHYRIDLFLANLQQPATEESQRMADKEGAIGEGLVFEVTRGATEAGAPGMVVVSQRCDLLADPAVEPLCEAVPLVIWPEGKDLPRPNSSRYFLMDRDTRLVADQSRRVMFEKSLLPDQEATNMLPADEQMRNFRAWCARRYSRLAFPDDFVRTIGAAVDFAVSRTSQDAAEAQAIHSWRVFLVQVDDNTIDVEVLVPFDETRVEDVTRYVDEVIAKAKQRLPKEYERARQRKSGNLRTFRIARHLAAPLGQLPARALIESEALDFDDLTYTGAEVRGVEPFEERLY